MGSTICGIFGSSSYKTYIKLYAKNRVRGDFAYGSLMVDSKLHASVKSAGVFKLNDKLYIGLKNNKKKFFYDFKNYLGHSQAPTSSERKYTHETAHPFNTGKWYVAHNGVLSNEKELRSILKNYKKSINTVDSSLIPAMIDLCCKKEKIEAKAICNALSMLEGTFGLWILNSKNNNTYLARSGSTLFADFLSNDFSSTKYNNYKAVEEGVLYLQTVEGLTAVGTFFPNSPFFTS